MPCGEFMCVWAGHGSLSATECFCRDLGQTVAVFGFNLPSSLPSPAAVQVWDGDLSLMAQGGLVWALSSWAILLILPLALLMAPVPSSRGDLLPRDFPDFFLWVGVYPCGAGGEDCKAIWQLLSQFSSCVQQVPYSFWHVLFLCFWGGETLPVLSLNKAKQSKASRVP